MNSTSWKIHKFGGSSLADADCFRRVAGLMLERPDKQLGVVVSAMGGMTDALLNLTALAEQGGTRSDWRTLCRNGESVAGRPGAGRNAGRLGG